MHNPYTYSSALGTSDCPTGTFHLNVSSRAMTWSDGLYGIHGFKRGDIVPSVELLLAHKHAEDRPRYAEIIAQVLRTGGYFCIYHRIIDSHGRIRRVLSTGEGILDRRERDSDQWTHGRPHRDGTTRNRAGRM